MPGFFDFVWDEQLGKVLLNVKEFEKEFLYVNSLSAGVGSNDIGLDRGQLGNTRVVKFIKSGNKILLLQPNFDYRAVSDNPDEVKSVNEAFAQSVIWGFEAIEADEGFLIDMNAFLLRDAHGVGTRLNDMKEGTYNLDLSRSALYKPGIKNFPKNSEFEAMITFTGKPKGYNIRSVTPSGDAVTVRMHHSFIELPDDNYKPRKFDPRGGFFGITYYDYATPIDQPLMKKFIARHRLEKKDPTAALSEAVEPIVYYLDRGAPEPVKSALLEGASWWNQAFEAAGFKDAFQVKVLPEGADPLDVRYNVIQWVHRSTRGWSYGASVRDPRTGEIIKGHVSLGSLRVRQDFLIAAGLLSPYASDNVTDEMKEMALARLRQLSAHEVGHTLGLAHNFAASMNNRASVMDYPHPYFEMSGDEVNLNDAYDTNIGEWDKVAIKFGYSQFDGNEAQELDNILNDAFGNQKLQFITDQDARPQGGAHAAAHLWDNGTDAADELTRLMGIRRSVITNFSENSIPKGTPMANIEEVLVPMYFMHRYQLEGAVKVLGGLQYNYALRGDNQEVVSYIDRSTQMKALNALLATLEPQNLEIPENVLDIIPPRAFGYGRTRETFKAKTGVMFDPLTPAETVASVVVGLILNPERMSRLVALNAVDPLQPGLSLVVDQILEATWKSLRSDHGYHRALERSVEKQVLIGMLTAAANSSSDLQANAILISKIKRLQEWIQKESKKLSDDEKAHYTYALFQIDQFMEDPNEFKPAKALTPPDGSPIGMGCMSGDF